MNEQSELENRHDKPHAFEVDPYPTRPRQDPNLGWRKWAKPPALAAGAVFFVGTILAFLVSGIYFLAYVPAFLLSLIGLREHGSASGKTRRTGAVFVFNGLVLMLSLFAVGFISDFLQGQHELLDESVALAFTSVHIMLGTGLFLLDFRPEAAARKS